MNGKSEINQLDISQEEKKKRKREKMEKENLEKIKSQRPNKSLRPTYFRVDTPHISNDT